MHFFACIYSHSYFSLVKTKDRSFVTTTKDERKIDVPEILNSTVERAVESGSDYSDYWLNHCSFMSKTGREATTSVDF